jgi:hypothetical protein
MANKPTVELIGNDGNIYSVMARCQRAARKAGWDKQEIDTFIEKLKSSHNYDAALVVVMDHFEVE